VGTVFLLMGIVEYPPFPFLAGLILLTGGVSGLAGLGGAIIDQTLEKRGMQNGALRTLVIFLLITGFTFSISVMIIQNSRWGEAAEALQQYALPGMFLGLVFGILVALINYRLWTIQQKVNLLELENRYLSELAEKDYLLQEAARNLAVAEERNSMARELHDSISQGIHGIVFSTRSLRRQLGSNHETEEILLHLEQTTQATLQELRRLIMELTPSPLENTTLVEALQLHCDLFSRRQQIAIKLALDYRGTLAPEQEVAVYRIVQEALANVQKHAAARHVELTLTEHEENIRLTILDNGCGFEPANANTGNGLGNMAMRARQNNGEFMVFSSPGTGTKVDILLQKYSF
jgi:signal transduction histidine kinase